MQPRLVRRAGRLALVATVAALATVTAMVATSPSSAASAATLPAGDIRFDHSPTAIGDSYIVVFKDQATTSGVTGTAIQVGAAATTLASRYGGTARQIFSGVLDGFELSASGSVARHIASDPAVAFVERNQRFHAMQVNPPWNLDRIDQHQLPLNQLYSVSSTASTVHAYIVDTGILMTHREFGGRATSGWDFVNNDPNATDCNGHGTHVAGVVGGTTYGVAKRVQLVGVQVLNCAGAGSTATVISGINWVTANAVRPAVANLSLGGSASAALDSAVSASIAAGISYSVAAGGSGSDACAFSPARVPTALTVGSTDQTDTRASFSNYGPCLDLFAPGASIKSAWHTSPTAAVTLSGTSTSAPHVAGGAALILAAHPQYTSAQVAAALIAAATPGVVGNPGPGSPNLLLFVS